MYRCHFSTHFRRWHKTAAVQRAWTPPPPSLLPAVVVLVVVAVVTSKHLPHGVPSSLVYVRQTVHNVTSKWWRQRWRQLHRAVFNGTPQAGTSRRTPRRARCGSVLWNNCSIYFDNAAYSVRDRRLISDPWSWAGSKHTLQPTASSTRSRGQQITTLTTCSAIYLRNSLLHGLLLVLSTPEGWKTESA